MLCLLFFLRIAVGYEVYVEVAEDDGTSEAWSYTDGEQLQTNSNLTGTGTVGTAEFLSHQTERMKRSVNESKEVPVPPVESYTECVTRVAAASAGQYQKAFTVDLYDVMRLPCHFCGQKTDEMLSAKTWFKFSKLVDKESGDVVWRPDEVELDMHDDEAMNRVYVLPDHTLVIENFQISDKGTYFCERYTASSRKLEQYAFRSVDLIALSAASMAAVFKQLTGDQHASFLSYVDIDFPIKARLVTSDGRGYPLPTPPLRNETANWMLFTQWETWSTCNSCGEDGERRRKGHCRLRPLDPTLPTSPHYFHQMLRLYPEGAPCHSTMFVHDTAILSRPHEIEVAGCWEHCETTGRSVRRAAGRGRGKRRGRRADDDDDDVAFDGVFSSSIHISSYKGPRNKKVFKDVHRELFAPVGGNVDMICPGAGSSHSVRWNKDAVRMDTRALMVLTAGRLYVTPVHVLVISRIVASDNATYMCWYAETPSAARRPHARYVLKVDIEKELQDLKWYWRALLVSYILCSVPYAFGVIVLALTRARFQQKRRRKGPPSSKRRQRRSNEERPPPYKR